MASQHRTRLATVVGALALVVGLGLLSAQQASQASGDPSRAEPARDATNGTSTYGLSWADGMALGVVEGITEYLPISSTGHLVVTQRFLDLDPPDGPARDALNSYTVVIQVGAIFAVLLLYRKRVGQIVSGIGGRNATGRRLFLALLIAFVPAGVVAKLFEDVIDEHLLEPAPVAWAWLVGGIGLVAGASWLRRYGETGRSLDEMTLQQAAFIGAAQVAALWPGISRSLVTIVGALLAGLAIGAAVEFSFLLGLATLSIATLYEILTNGSEIVDNFGLGAPLIGILAAFISAAAAVKLFVDYLNRRDLRVFGVYRILIAAGTFALLATNVI